MADVWICLSRRHDIWTVIDEKHYPFVAQWPWNYRRDGRGGKIYAKRNEGPARTPVYLHRALQFHISPLPMELQGRYPNGRWKRVADHADGDRLNNREENLRWLSKSEDVINSWNRRVAADGTLICGSLRARALENIGMNPELFLDQPVSRPSRQIEADFERPATLVQAREKLSLPPRRFADACKRSQA